jgi:putative addiction module component (TIGR02574 family)
MTTISELKTLPLPEKLQLVEDLWDLIASDQNSLPDHPAVIERIRRRRARFDANPDSGVTWDEMKKRIRNGHA